MSFQLGSPPSAGDDVEVLWRHVAELYKVVHALQNMTLIISSAYPTQGVLEIQDDKSVMKVT